MGGRGVPAWLREDVLARDGLVCQYCERELVEDGPWPYYPTLDHVIPRSRGGQTELENLVVACQPCNQRKRDRTPSEAHMRLLQQIGDELFGECLHRITMQK